MTRPVLALLAETGHFLLTEAADRVTALLLDFLARNAGAATEPRDS